MALNCPSMVAVDEHGTAPLDGRVHFAMSGPSPARSLVGLRLELPAPMRVHLAVFDVLGRRLATLIDGELPSGPTRLSWDGRNANGASVGPGVYFARLTCAAGRSVVRLPLVR